MASYFPFSPIITEDSATGQDLKQLQDSTVSYVAHIWTI